MCKFVAGKCEKVDDPSAQSHRECSFTFFSVCGVQHEFVYLTFLSYFYQHITSACWTHCSGIFCLCILSDNHAEESMFSTICNFTSKWSSTWENAKSYFYNVQCVCSSLSESERNIAPQCLHSRYWSLCIRLSSHITVATVKSERALMISFHSESSL